MKFGKYNIMSKSFLLNESITYNYRVPRNMQKQCMDFFILSLLWKNNVSEKSSYYKKSSTNQDLKKIMEESISDIVKYQRANLYRICISILALEVLRDQKEIGEEEKRFSSLSEIKNKWDTYEDKNYFRVIPEIMKNYNITPNNLIKSAEIHPEKSVQLVAGIVQILKSAEELEDQIDKIRLIYNKIRKNQWILDRFPKAKTGWKEFLDNIHDNGQWNISKYSSMPIRIISFLAKYKGIDVDDKLVNRGREIKQLSDNTKKTSYKLLLSYLKDREDVFRKALKSSIKSLDDETIHFLIIPSFMEDFVFDAVYNNRKYKSPKLNLSTSNNNDILSLDPFRYYDEQRKEIGIWLGEKSKTQITLKSITKKIPKFMYTKFASDFEDYKKHYLKKNNVSSIGNTKKQELSNFEILYP